MSESKPGSRAWMMGVMDAAFAECRALREAGQKEYAHRDENCFANFERVAERQGLRREQVLLTYMEKHLDGIHAYVQGHRSQRESVRGRINDAIVYLCLLRGMVAMDEAEAERKQRENRENIEAAVRRGEMPAGVLIKPIGPDEPGGKDVYVSPWRGSDARTGELGPETGPPRKMDIRPLEEFSPRIEGLPTRDALDIRVANAFGGILVKKQPPVIDECSERKCDPKVKGLRYDVFCKASRTRHACCHACIASVVHEHSIGDCVGVEVREILEPPASAPKRSG